MTAPMHDPAFVAALFDRCAARYRWWSVAASFGMVPWWRRICVGRLMGQRQIAALASRTRPDPAPVIADLMAGTGEVWPLILAELPRAEIRAYDISREMHAHAMDRLHRTRARRISHTAADVLTEDLEPDSVDAVICVFGLKTLDKAQQDRLAWQIARVLRPGGVFAMIEASDPTGWALRPLYRLYLDRVLPLIEGLFLRGAQDFAYLGAYTRAFGDCSHMEGALRRAGLPASSQSHVFGCATSLAGRKPVAPVRDGD